MTPRMLSYISTEISNGRPIWGLLRANEYLPANDLFRCALRHKARQAIAADPYLCL